MRKELLKELQGKFVFFDFDGTLAEYRFNSKVFGDEETGGQTLSELIFENDYQIVRPLCTMKKYVEKLNPDKIFVLGAVITNHEIDQKYVWLQKYFPQFKRENIIFLSDSHFKVKALKAFAEKFNLKYDAIVLVDDKHTTIYEAEKEGFVAYHPSSFVE